MPNHQHQSDIWAKGLPPHWYMEDWVTAEERLEREFFRRYTELEQPWSLFRKIFYAVIYLSVAALIMKVW